MSENLKTYAPESVFKKTEEFILPTMGSGVEVAVAWNERVIADYHFHQQGTISVGSHPSCDIQLPLIHLFIDKIDLIKINHGISVNIPMGMRSELMIFDEQNRLHSKPLQEGQNSLSLQQKEMLYIYLTDSIKLIIRPSQQSIQPKVIPFLDLSSDGFLSLALSVAISAIIALLVQMNPSVKPYSVDDEEFKPALIIQSPERIAKILKLPPPKVDFTKPQTKPVVQKPSVTTQKPTASLQKSPTVKVPGNKTKPSSLAKSNNKTSNKVGSKFNQGQAIKTTAKPTSQAKSPDPKKSGIFAVMSTAGRNPNPDTEYDGGGGLAGLANKFTGTTGSHIDHAGDRFGDRFKQASSNTHGENNVGVEGLKGTGGLGPGLGDQSLGERKSVSIIPSGDGAVFSGEIDREGIRKVFFDNARALRSCYERSLNGNTQLSGTLTLNFDIGEQGRVVGKPKVDRGMSSFYEAAMADCITNRLRSWRFPPPPRNNVVNVLYPLAFSAK